MSQKYNKKMNINLSGTSFTDESHANLGASAFSLDHDWFINDVSSGDVLVIRTAAAGGGTLLVLDTDYSVSNQDNILSDEDHVNKAVYSDITIINVAYQATTLYFSGKYVADSVDEKDISQVTWQYEAKTATETLAPDTYTTYGCAAGANGIKLTLPAVSEYYKNIRLEFIKTDNTNTAVMIDGSGAETINGLTHVLLIEQYQKIEIICTGTTWIITDGTLISDSGWIARSDWTVVHIGTVDVDYDNLVGTFQIGEKVTESGGETGIVVKDTGTTLTLWRVTDSGVFTNNNTLTGGISNATADVDEAGTGSTKDVDSNFYHGFGKNVNSISNITLMYSTDGTEANMQGAFLSYTERGTGEGVSIHGVDTNNFKIQTATNGFSVIIDNGTINQLTSDDDFYRVVAKLII